MKAAEIDGSLAEGLGFALETVAPESLVIKPVQVRFSNYLGQHWSETFRTSDGEAIRALNLKV